MDVIRQYVLPKSTLPRYSYTDDKVYRLNKKCQRLFHKCGLKDNTKVFRFGDVILNIQSKQNEIILRPDELITGNRLGDFNTRTFRVDEINSADRIYAEPDQPEVWVAALSRETRDSFPSHFGRLTVLICHKENITNANRLLFIKAPNAHPAYSFGYVFRATREDFAKDLNNLLELYVLSYLKPRANVSDFILSTGMIFANREVTIGETLEYKNNLLRKLSNIPNVNVENRNERVVGNTVASIEDLQVVVISDNTESSERHVNESVDTDSPFSVSFVHHFEALRDETVVESAKNILTEVAALCMRSNVPFSEWPAHIVPPQTKEELPVPGVQSCGYRLGTFHVIVDKDVPMSEDEIKQRVVRVLEVYGDRRDKRCLIRYNADPFVKLQSETAFESGFDNSRENRIVRFKNEHGKLKDSLIYDFQDRKIETLVGLPVYIWGASSRLQKGIIMTPELFMRSRFGCMIKVVQIEEDSDSDSDSDEGAYGGTSYKRENRRFATEYDNHAIVCHQEPSDKLVHLIGELCSILVAQKTRQRGSRTKRTYLSLSYK